MQPELIENVVYQRVTDLDLGDETFLKRITAVKGGA